MRIVSIWVLAVALVGFVLTRWACVPFVPAVEIRQEEEPERTVQQDASPDAWQKEIQILPADQINRLRVEWGEPQRFDYKRGFRHSPELAISGKLLLLQEDGKTYRPVKQPLLLAVALSVRPDEKIDWSRGINQSYHEKRYTVGYLDGFLLGKPPHTFPHEKPKNPLPPGVFSANLLRSLICTEPGKTRAFQVGLCLGEMNRSGYSWQIIPQSVRMVNIPGPAPISNTVQLINGCATPLGWEYDPIPVVRAVNHLRPLGKEKALAVMRDFYQFAYCTGYTRERIDQANLETSNQYCLETILRVLFPNIDQERTFIVWQGIPFHRYVTDGTSGWPAFTKQELDRAEKEGMLLGQTLRPTDDPLTAVETLYAKIANPADEKEKEFYFKRSLRDHLRNQAWRMVRHLIDNRGEKETFDEAWIGWNALKDKVARLNIRWDEQKQEYVAGEKP